MKKRWMAIFLCALLALGCAAPAAGEIPDTDADPMRVLATVLRNAQEIAFLDAAALCQAGPETGIGRTLTGDGAAVRITATQEEAWGGVGGSLRDYDNGMDVFNRACLFRFRLPAFWDFQLVIGEQWIQFYEPGYPMFGGSAYPYPNFCFGEFPQTYRLLPDQWTYGLIALDGDANCRFMLWQEGHADVPGYYARKLFSSADMARMRAEGELPGWALSVKLYEGESIEISEFRVLRFEELIK